MISNQIKNLIRNNYGNYCRPCLKCAAAESGDLCYIYGKQSEACPLFANWVRTRKQAYDAKLPVSINDHEYEINSAEYSDIDIISLMDKLNTKMKEVRSTLLQSMEEKGHLCYKVGDQYMRVTECTSKKSLTIEMVLEALHTFTIDELSIEDAIDGLTDKMEHVRSTTKKYVKMMKQPPKIKTQIVDLNEADTSIIEDYKNTENMLNTVRNEEKESSKMLQEQVKSLIAPVEGYMKRVDLSTQRIQLGDKEVKGLAHTFYLRRREKTTSKKLSKKLLNLLKLNLNQLQINLLNLLLMMQLLIFLVLLIPVL